jgi:hypothetical protein
VRPLGTLGENSAWTSCESEALGRERGGEDSSMVEAQPWAEARGEGWQLREPAGARSESWAGEAAADDTDSRLVRVLRHGPKLGRRISNPRGVDRKIKGKVPDGLKRGNGRTLPHLGSRCKYE